MNAGMLWYDGSKRPIEDKVREAAAYYLKKYGVSAAFCMVQTEAVEKSLKVDGVLVQPARYVMPNHLWLGVDDGG